MELDINKQSQWSNDEAEKEVLGIALVAPEKVADICSRLSVDSFFSTPHRLIFKAILDLKSRDKEVDIVTVSEWLRFHEKLEASGGRDYINDLAMNVACTSNYKNYCGIILNYAKKRELASICLEAQSQLNNNTDVESVAEWVKTRAENVMMQKQSDKLSHIIAGLDNVVDKINKVLTSENKILGLATSFPSLDTSLSGLCKGRLYLLGARPAMGKSSFAMGIASYVANDVPVVFASLEMGLDEYTERELFSMCGTNQDMISNGMVTPEIYEKIYKASEELADKKLYILDDANCKLSTIESAIVSCQSKYGECGLVIIDYLQLMASDDKRLKDDYDIVTRNSKGLKKLARKYNVPVLALCQLSRQLEARSDKRPILSDLRDSGSLEQDADVVMFLYRDEVYNPHELDNKGKAELIIRKNRQGRCGTIDLTFQASKTKFKERSSYGYQTGSMV